MRTKLKYAAGGIRTPDLRLRRCAACAPLRGWVLVISHVFYNHGIIIIFDLWQTAAQQRIFIAGIFGHFQHARHAVWKILNGKFVATFAEHTSEVFVGYLFKLVAC